jgi:hypothetical protein
MKRIVTHLILAMLDLKKGYQNNEKNSCKKVNIVFKF